MKSKQIDVSYDDGPVTIEGVTITLFNIDHVNGSVQLLVKKAEPARQTSSDYAHSSMAHQIAMIENSKTQRD